MKWALASAGLLLLIVVFSLAALDQKNVVWTNNMPYCPHCRSEVKPFSNLCATCRQAFDWETREDPCPACLSDLDAKWIAGKIEGRDAEIGAAFLAAAAPEVAVPDFIAWLREIESGSCTFCGGTGKWLAPGVGELPADNGHASPEVAFLRDKLAGRCPACMGTGRCILCDGDHRVTHGRESSARDIEDLTARLATIDPLRDPASTERAFELTRDFLQKNAGRAEVERAAWFDLSALAPVNMANRRLDLVRQVLSALP